MERGTVVAGFRVERALGDGSVGTVYEAIQVSLARPVALRLIPASDFADRRQIESYDERQRQAAALHHPGLLPSFAAGEWDGGRYVASRLVRGRNMAELLAAGKKPGPESIDSLADALSLVHAAGLDCGGLQPDDVLVDGSGRAYLAKVGLGAGGGPAVQAADRQCLESLRSGLSEQRQGRRRLYALGGVAVCVLAAVVAVAALRGSEGRPGVPEPPPGTTSLGSAREGSGDAVGCSDPVSLNAPACTMEQLRVGGEPLIFERPGVIRSWSVAGTSGELALQVVRRRGPSTFVARFSQPLESSEGEVAFQAADLAVRSGDRIAVRLGPGTTIGVEPRPGARFQRWEGGLTPDRQPGNGDPLDGQLRLRVDVEYGARAEGPEQLLGRAAARAEHGEILLETAMSRRGQGPSTVRLVRSPEGVALDVFDGTRIARLIVPDADPSGRPSELISNCGGGGTQGFCVRWQNPGLDPVLFHVYHLRNDGRLQQIG